MTSTVSETTNIPAAQDSEAAPRFSSLDGWLIVLMVIWGTNFAVLKSAGEAVTPLVFNALRFTLGALVLCTIFKLNGAKVRLPRAEWGSLILIALLNDVYQVVFVTALSKTTVANNALILTTTPVWIVLINAFRGRERIRRSMITGMFMALIGVLIVILARYASGVSINESTLPGDLMTVGASLLWVVLILYSRAPLQRNPTVPATFWILVWSAVFNVVFALPYLSRMDWAGVNTSVIWASCYSGILSIGVGNVIWNSGVQKLGTSRTAIYTYLEPVVAATAAIIFLREAFSLWFVIGTILVFGGVILVKKG